MSRLSTNFVLVYFIFRAGLGWSNSELKILSKKVLTTKVIRAKKAKVNIKAPTTFICTISFSVVKRMCIGYKPLIITSSIHSKIFHPLMSWWLKLNKKHFGSSRYLANIMILDLYICYLSHILNCKLKQTTSKLNYKM